MRPFEYSAPNTVDEAIRTAAHSTSVRYIGGGTNILDLMKMGVERPAHLVDINHLPLGGIDEWNGGLRLGALATNTEVAHHRLVRTRYPVLSQAILNGASQQLRNMATTGGNPLQRTRCHYFYDPAYSECNKRKPGSGCAAIGGYNRIHAILGASPHCIATHPSDMCVALAALDAVLQVQGPSGKRSIPMSEFHRLPGDTPHLDTNLQRGELVTAIDLPALPLGTRSHYLKIRDRNSYAFALVSVAAVVDLDETGAMREVRIALGGVAHKPWRAARAEQALQGKKPEDATLRNAAAEELLDAKGFQHNAFKIELAKRSIVKALRTVIGAVA